MSENNPAAYKVGDIVNGHRLTDQDGTLAWLPIEPDPKPKRKWYTRKRVILPAAALLLVIIIGMVNRPAGDVKAEDATVDKPAAVKEVPAPPKIEKATVPDVAGMDAATAVILLERVGFQVPVPEDPDAIVTGTSPAKGGIAIVGTTVNLTVEVKPKLTLSQQNAVGQAESYLSHMPFSRTGLIGQLEYEGYNTADATFAVDFVAPDWNAQAVAQAESYLSHQSFSREGLYDQLLYEGFTDAQANAGLAGVGY